MWCWWRFQFARIQRDTFYCFGKQLSASVCLRACVRAKREGTPKLNKLLFPSLDAKIKRSRAEWLCRISVKWIHSGFRHCSTVSPHTHNIVCIASTQWRTHICEIIIYDLPFATVLRSDIVSKTGKPFPIHLIKIHRATIFTFVIRVASTSHWCWYRRDHDSIILLIEILFHACRWPCNRYYLEKQLLSQLWVSFLKRRPSRLQSFVWNLLRFIHSKWSTVRLQSELICPANSFFSAQIFVHLLF